MTYKDIKYFLVRKEGRVASSLGSKCILFFCEKYLNLYHRIVEL